MLNPFQITKPVSPSHALAEEDVLKTKSALSKLGHYKEPEGGSTPWPDTPLFEGLKAFQKDQGLKVDGLMKPGGPTEKALRASTGPFGSVPAIWNSTYEPPRPEPLPHIKQDHPGPTLQKFSKPEHTASSNSATRPKHEAPAKGQGDQKQRDNDETRVAIAPAAALPWILGTGAAVATGDLLRRKAEEMMRNNGGTVPPLMPTDPEPPTPPSVRPSTDLKPNREDIPVPPPHGPEKRENPAETPEPTIEIFPGANAFAKRIGSIVERNEREDTARQIDELRDIVLDENKGWKHEAGGRNKKTGKQMKEYYAPGPGHGFPLPGRETGDGRKLSGRTDLTIKSPDGKYFKHYQTVDVDRNGKPTKRELDNAERIWRNLRNEDGYVHYIILVPKTWQKPK